MGSIVVLFRNRLLRISSQIFEWGVKDNALIVVYRGKNTSKWQLLVKSSRKKNQGNPECSENRELTQC
jgi:hypothetical protein